MVNMAEKQSWNLNDSYKTVVMKKDQPIAVGTIPTSPLNTYFAEPSMVFGRKLYYSEKVVYLVIDTHRIISETPIILPFFSESLFSKFSLIRLESRLATLAMIMRNVQGLMRIILDLAVKSFQFLS
jgi:hypothetical protein